MGALTARPAVLVFFRVMSFQIQKGEGLSAAFERIASEEMQIAISELEGQTRSEAVHNARKAIKRLRALLRSMRAVFPDDVFRAENQRLANAGRAISPLRDVHVQLRTLGQLNASRNPVGSKIRHDLLQQQKDFTRRIPILRKIVRDKLGDPRQTMHLWPLSKTTPQTLVASLKRIYKNGRKAFKAACKDPLAEHLHEWRKKTKALGYGFELIECLVPKKIAKMTISFTKLGDKLGDDHDLFMVLEILREAHRGQSTDDYTGLAERISKKRSKLKKQAFRLGKKVYRDKPRAFAKRLNRCLG